MRKAKNPPSERADWPTWTGKRVTCLACGREMDSATGATPGIMEGPKAGDISICLHCGHIMAYADRQGTLRPLTDAEMLDVAGNPVILGVQRRLAALRKEAT